MMKTPPRGHTSLSRLISMVIALAGATVLLPTRGLAQTTPAPASSVGQASVTPSASESPAAAAAAEWYPATLDFGTGLIVIPVAWISPNSSDFWMSYGGMHMSAPSGGVPGGTPVHWNGNFAIDTHWAQRFDVGLSLYSNNPEWGLFGQVLAVREGQFSTFMPAIAFGARNIGPYSHEERFLIGGDVVADSSGHTHEATPSYFKNFNTAPTLYAVATKSIPVNTKWLSSVGVTLGYGDGLFSNTGGLGTAYDKSGTIVRGMFFGARTVTHLSTNTTVSFVGENDGWDWNAGAVAAWRGLSAGLYVTELDKGSAVNPASLSLYNYRKYNVALGYSGNFHEVVNGHVLRTQITELQQEQHLLRGEVGRREHMIVQLEARMTDLQQKEFGDSSKERQQLEQELEQERAAIQRANDRLKQLQGGKTQ